MCGARYVSRFGVMVEITDENTGVSMWFKAALPEMDMWDRVEKIIQGYFDMLPEAQNAADVIRNIPVITTMDREVCLRPVRGKNGTYKIDLVCFNAMNVIDWNQLDIKT